MKNFFLLNNVFAVQIVQNNIKDAEYTTDIYKLIPITLSYIVL